MHIGNYLELVHKSEQDLAKAFRMVADEHGDEPDVKEICLMLATWSDQLVADLQPFVARYSEERNKEPDRLMNTLFHKPRKGGLALLRDLHDVWLIASETHLCCIILRQAADGLRDKELTNVCNKIEQTARRQLSWLLTRMKTAAPQTLIVAS
ncbi:MAG TPA: hypothetical protein VNS32_26740 [Flavisolibacter sp.]|nr:hypothetical protein [Flavisolibacter sp.]